MAARRDEQTEPLRLLPGRDSPWILDGRYRVLRRLAAGATAEVFIARDERLDRDVAVKLFRLLVDDTDDHGEHRRQLELTALARLSHPNLVALLDGSLGGPDAQPYLVLELVDGPDLASLLRDGPLPESDVRLIGAQVADALAYAHAQGMVHRDVKPANILLGSDGPDGAMRTRLSDFGTVRLVDGARMTATDFTIGTATYLSPEQARGDEVGPKADIYSLGLVLIEALTGRRCFPGSVHESLAARLTTSPTIPSTLPQPWPGLLAAMTARDPALRPDAAEVAETLHGEVAPMPLSGRRVAAPLPVPSSPGATSPAASGDLVAGDEVSDSRTARVGWRSWLLIAALVVAGLAAGAGVALSGHHGTSRVDQRPVSSGTQQASRSPSSSARHSSAATMVNTDFNAPALVASPRVRSSRSAAAPSQRHRARRPQPAVPTTSADVRTPSASASSTMPTSPPASSSPSLTPSLPTSVSPSPTPPASP